MQNPCPLTAALIHATASTLISSGNPSEAVLGDRERLKAGGTAAVECRIGGVPAGDASLNAILSRGRSGDIRCIEIMCDQVGARLSRRPARADASGVGVEGRTKLGRRNIAWSRDVLRDSGGSDSHNHKSRKHKAATKNAVILHVNLLSLSLTHPENDEDRDDAGRRNHDGECLATCETRTPRFHNRTRYGPEFEFGYIVCVPTFFMIPSDLC